MSGHLQKRQVEELLAPGSPGPARAAAVRHLLTGCERCAALARQVLREHGFRLAGGRLAPPPAAPVPETSYDEVFDRLLRRLPELVAQAMSRREE